MQTGIGVAATVLVVAIVAFAAMVRWDDWYLNFDGGIYLSLATNLRRGAGFVFPDGSFADFRGPIYPGLIAAAWLFVTDTARSAIWVSRLVLVANAVLLALIVWRLSRRWLVALVAGIVVAVQPLVLISGALFFVPDGAAVLFVLAAVLAYVWHPSSTVKASRLALVGVLFGLAFLAKQTGALGGLIVVTLLVSTHSGGVQRPARAIPVLGLGFLAPVGAWSVYTLVEAGRLPSGVPGPGGVVGGLMVLGGIIALLAVWPIAASRMPVAAAQVQLPGWVAVMASFVAALAGLVLLGSAAIVPITELWTALRADLLTQIYRDTPWGILLIPLAIGIAWGAMHLTNFGTLAASSMTVVGMAGIVYAALTGAGFRNGLLVVYGLSALLALAAEGLWSAPRQRALWRSVAVIGVALAIGVSLIASEVTNDRLPERALTAENPAVADAVGWLDNLAADTVIAGTPLYLSTLWRLALPHPPLDLVPLHTIGRAEWDAGERTFPHRVDWAGTVPDPIPLTDPIGVSSARVQLSSFMGPVWATYLDQTQPEYLIVTGNAVFPKSAFDGGLVLPYLEASPSAHAVYRSGEKLLPQWVMIYGLSYPFVAPATPVIVHRAADLPLESIAPDEIALTSPQYREMVTEILRRPFG